MSYQLTSSMHCNVCAMVQTDLVRIENRIKQNFVELRTCRGCRLVKYCEKGHQCRDWKNHSEFCRAIQRITKTYKITHPFELGNSDGDIKNEEAFENTIIRLKHLATEIMRRPLTCLEQDLLSFPAVCAVCFQYRLPIIICEKCECQVYCSMVHFEQHKPIHKQICAWLQLYYTPFKITPFNNNLKLKAVNTVADFRKIDLIEAFEIVYRTKIPTNPIRKRDDYQLFSYAADFSCITTICYALSYTKMEAMTNGKFVIFIIGATVEGVLWFKEDHVCFFFYHYPKIVNLEIHLIGPNVQTPDPICLNFTYSGYNRKVIFKCFKGLIQDYMAYEKAVPYLIVIYNCGFSRYSHYKHIPDINMDDAADKEQDENKNKQVCAKTTRANSAYLWSGGFLGILQFFDVPIILTSLTKLEAEFDFAALLSATIHESLHIKVERIFKLQKNPYHDLRPLRQWHAHDDEKIFFRNNYIQGIRTYITSPIDWSK